HAPFRPTATGGRERLSPCAGRHVEHPRPRDDAGHVEHRLGRLAQPRFEGRTRAVPGLGRGLPLVGRGALVGAGVEFRGAHGSLRTWWTRTRRYRTRAGPGDEMPVCAPRGCSWEPRGGPPCPATGRTWPHPPAEGLCSSWPGTPTRASCASSFRPVDVWMVACGPGALSLRWSIGSAG